MITSKSCHAANAIYAVTYTLLHSTSSHWTRYQNDWFIDHLRKIWQFHLQISLIRPSDLFRFRTVLKIWIFWILYRVPWVGNRSIARSVPAQDNTTQCNADIKIVASWDIGPCHLVEVYRHLNGTCCLHHRKDHCPDLEKKQLPLKRLSISIRIHSKTSQKSDIFILVAARAWNLTTQKQSVPQMMFGFKTLCTWREYEWSLCWV
jgi:hypothetical protein